MWDVWGETTQNYKEVLISGFGMRNFCAIAPERSEELLTSLKVMGFFKKEG